MLHQRNPHEAYRRVEFDAQVASARPEQLVSLCYDQLSIALGSAVRASELGDNRRRSDGLTRALAAVTALQMGVNRSAPGAEALLRFYGGVRRAVLDCVPNFDAARLTMVKKDVEEVALALVGEQDRSDLE